MNTPKRIVALIAGTGTILQTVLDAIHHNSLGGCIVAAISHEPYSYGLLRAEREGIPTLLHDISEYRYSEAGERGFQEELIEKAASFAPDLIVLAGWNLPLSDEFFQHFPNKVVNIQVGLPGQFPPFDPYGQNPVSRAYELYRAGLTRETHFSMQILQNSAGSGPMVNSIQVPIHEFDNLIDLEERMTRAQQELLENTLRLLLRDNEY